METYARVRPSVAKEKPRTIHFARKLLDRGVFRLADPNGNWRKSAVLVVQHTLGMRESKSAKFDVGQQFDYPTAVSTEDPHLGKATLETPRPNLFQRFDCGVFFGAAFFLGRRFFGGESKLRGKRIVIQTRCTRRCGGPLFALLLLGLATSACGYTNNIMITGFWPPTNEMIRQFSPNPAQNPGGWVGDNWENRGYDIHAFFPEFNNFPVDQQGEGDFEVDYQDTLADFDRITAELDPIAIITFSRGDAGNSWEIESRHENRLAWNLDFEVPRRPTPRPPDDTLPANASRFSSLPMEEIRDAVDSSGLGMNVFIDTNSTGGSFVSEYIGYLNVWYHDRHSDPSDPAWNVAGGHIHVGGAVSIADGTVATEISLRTLIDHVDSIVPEPSSAGLLWAFVILPWMMRRAA